MRARVSDVFVEVVSAKIAMLSDGLETAVMTCPSCEQENSLRLWLVGDSKHLRGACCGEGCDLEVME